MTKDTATVNIPNDVFEPIVQAQVRAGIVAAIGNPEELIARVVDIALQKKVDYSGNVSKYSSDNKYDMVELLAQKAINTVVKEALEEWVVEQKAAIREQVKKTLAKKQSAFAKALVDGLVGAATQTWQFNCEMKLPRDY